MSLKRDDAGTLVNPGSIGGITRGRVDSNTSALRSARGAAMLALLFATLLCSERAFGQKPQYEFYYEYRTVFSAKVQEENHWSLTNEQVFERYAARLKSDGIAESEIARRLRLLRTEHDALETDYYSRYYLDSNSNFSHAPNRFLMQMVKGRQPGVALDYGMGQGRNSIYLASLGWQVWGFDPAEAGVAIARKQAKDLGLTLNTSPVATQCFICLILLRSNSMRSCGISRTGKVAVW